MTGALRRRLLHVPSADWTWSQVFESLVGRGTPTSVADLEASASQVLGVKVVAFGSCRTAIAVALELAAPPGRVHVPAYTCVAVPNAVQTAGREVSWVDIDGANMDLDAVAAVARPGDVVLAQHTYGIPLDPARLAALADRGIIVIEDRAHRFDGSDLVGLGVFSMEHSKITSAGQGGLLASPDEALREAARRVRDRLPMPARGAVRRILWTSAVQAGLAGLEPTLGPGADILRRLARRVPAISAPAQADEELTDGRIESTAMHPDIAAIGVSSLSRIGLNLDHRRSLARFYQAHLGDLVPPWGRVDLPLVRQPILVGDADAITVRLRSAGLDLGLRWFNAPIHPRGSWSTYIPGTAPRAEALAATVLSLPTHLRVTRRMASQIVRAVRAAVG